MKALIVHLEARAELHAAAAWYNEQQPGLGLDLLDEVEAAFGKIIAHPGIGARYRSTSMRFYRLGRFPYLVYYRELADSIWVAAVAHERRRPNYWRSRKVVD